MKEKQRYRIVQRSGKKAKKITVYIKRSGNKGTMTESKGAIIVEEKIRKQEGKLLIRKKKSIRFEEGTSRGEQDELEDVE